VAVDVSDITPELLTSFGQTKDKVKMNKSMYFNTNTNIKPFKDDQKWSPKAVDLIRQNEQADLAMFVKYMSNLIIVELTSGQ
jgi:hypothetical protein